MFGRLAVLLSILVVSAATAGGLRAQEPMRVVMVTHGAAVEPFWAMVKAGADQAAEDMGVEVVYRAPETFDLEAMAGLVAAAVAERPDGLITSIPSSEALAAPLRAAADAGVPLISINSGFDVAAGLGSRLHVGQSEYEAGRVAGEKLREMGGTKALCINHEVGNVALDLRCKGLIDGFAGSVEVLPVEPDPAAAKAAVAERLAADPAIDVVLALSASVAGEPAIAIAGETARETPLQVATFDLSEAVLRAVAGGSAAFAVDQQPFLQGYLPVQYLVLLHRNGVLPVSNVSTGPRLVTAADAAERLAEAEGKTE